MGIILAANNIHKSYNTTEVLKGVDLEIAQSELIAITGASGAGKSTLLHILGTLDTADKGTVTFKGKDLTTLSDKALTSLRNQELGFIFQFHNLLPEFSALENVILPGLIGNRSKKELEEQAQHLLKLLNLSHRTHNRPNELSGGEQQRVAVARALINQPDIVFADEPSGNLDSKNAEELHELFFKLREELQHTFVIVTHNNSFAESADRQIVMKDGLIA